MTSQTQALTAAYGLVAVEEAVPLQQLACGDLVLGVVDPDNPDRPRTVHTVTAALGKHHVPTEDPTVLERLLTRTGFEQLFAGERVEGILVAGHAGPGLFALEDTPVLERVIL